MADPGGLAQRILRVAKGEDGEGPLVQRLCRAWVEGLGIEAVSMSLMTQHSSRRLLCASNAVALRVEEIQFTVAQGPCIAAAQSGVPVVVRDYARDATPWTGFGAVLREELPSVRSFYAFPMRLGEMVLGCIDVAGTVPGILDEGAVDEAARAADVTARVLVSEPHPLLPSTPYLGSAGSGDVDDIHWTATSRAVGVVAEQQDLEVEDALAFMRAQAFGSGRTLVEVTAEILAEFDNP